MKRTLQGFADADGSMDEDHHAVSGHAFLIEGHAVSWSFKHQEIVLLSTTESEYVAATHGPFGSETSSLKSSDLPLIPPSYFPTYIQPLRSLGATTSITRALQDAYRRVLPLDPVGG
jgi:hypothetical protein